MKKHGLHETEASITNKISRGPFDPPMQKQPKLGPAQRAVIAAFLCSAFALAIFDGQSSRQSTPPANSASAPGRADKDTSGKEKKTEGMTSDDWLAIFTLALVLVGGIQVRLFWVQLKLIRESLDDAKLAAEAAKESADAAKATADTAKEQVAVMKIGIFDLERAYLDAGPNEVITQFVMDPPPASGFFRPGDPMEVVVSIAIHNSGRTRASIKRAYGEFSQAPLGDQPIYNTLVGVTYFTDVSIAANQESPFPHKFSSRHVGDQFFFGFVEYNDIFHKTHISRFCMRVFPSTQNGGKGKLQFAGSDAWRECD